MSTETGTPVVGAGVRVFNARSAVDSTVQPRAQQIPRRQVRRRTARPDRRRRRHTGPGCR